MPFIKQRKSKIETVRNRQKPIRYNSGRIGHGRREGICRKNPSKSISIKRLVGLAHWNPQGLPAGIEPGIHESAFYTLSAAESPNELDLVNGSVTYGFVFDAVQVEVDIDTGEVKILDYTTIHDAGRLLNPNIVEGQIMGG